MEMERKRKRVKLDRISALPDHIIHHILSFLPSTKEAIQTTVLSKRWLNQWTRVPVIIFDFDFSDMYSYISSEDISRISRFIDNTLILYDCSKIKKLHVRLCQLNSADYPNWNVKLQFAIRKEVEELILKFICTNDSFKLPNFFFNYASLAKLLLTKCTLMPNGTVNWERLNNLYIESCSWSNQAIEGVVSGSPLLKSLEINNCSGFDRLAIASKSLERLVLVNHNERGLLLKFPVLTWLNSMLLALICTALFVCLMEKLKVFCGSPSLELLELVYCYVSKQLVIDSNFLKKLVLVDIYTDTIVISCPNLKELQLYALHSNKVKLMNLGMEICVTVDLAYFYDWLKNGNLGRMILKQLYHVEELNIGHCFIKILSTLEIRGVSSPSINIKCLTFDGGPNFVEHLPGIAYALRISSKLEKLVVILRRFMCGGPYNIPDMNLSGDNYWNSNGAVFNGFLSHLKIVKVFGLSKTDDQLELALDFVQFLLGNAKVLEKMAVIIEDCGADFVFKLSQKLLSFPRFSQHAVVEFLCSKSPSESKYAHY